MREERRAKVSLSRGSRITRLLTVYTVVLEGTRVCTQREKKAVQKQKTREKRNDRIASCELREVAKNETQVWLYT